jgi:hypothetical protein
MEDTFTPEYLTSLYNKIVANSGEPPELMGVGAGADGSFGHTDELRTLNYREAMTSPDHYLWEEAIRQEYLKLVKFRVFEVIPWGELPTEKKPVTGVHVQMQMLMDSSRLTAKAKPKFKEYIGNKIDIACGEDGIATIKFTQLVLIQKLEENHTPISSSTWV